MARLNNYPRCFDIHISQRKANSRLLNTVSPLRDMSLDPKLERLLPVFYERLPVQSSEWAGTLADAPTRVTVWTLYPDAHCIHPGPFYMDVKEAYLGCNRTW